MAIISRADTSAITSIFYTLKTLFHTLYAAICRNGSYPKKEKTKLPFTIIVYDVIFKEMALARRRSESGPFFGCN